MKLIYIILIIGILILGVVGIMYKQQLVQINDISQKYLKGILEQANFVAGTSLITLNSPVNNSNFNVSSVTFNVTSNATLSWCGVSINGSVNVSLSNVPSSLCYQETANVSTSCGGLSTGTYAFSAAWTNGKNAYDGDWGTYGRSASGLRSLYINYSIPTGASNATWRIKDGIGEGNITIPQNCWNVSTTKLSLLVSSDQTNTQTYWYCSLGGGLWNQLNQDATMDVYEEGVYWNMSNNNFNYTNSSIADGKYNFTITCNDTAGTFGNSGINYFLIDTVIPTLNVTSPTNSTYNSSSVLFNVSSSELGTGSIIPDIDNSLVSWWRMDDVNATTGVIDYMGRNNGTRVNAVQTSAGKLGKGMSFDGSSGYINLNNAMQYPNVSISALFKLSSKSDSKIYSNTENGGYQISVNAGGDNNLRFLVNIGGTYYNANWSLDNLNLENWYNVVGVYDSNSIMLYVDGILRNNNSISGTLSNSQLSFSSIGAEPGAGPAYTQFFNGTIDDVMIFNRSLSSDEILSIYNATKYQHTQTNLTEGAHTFKAYTQDLAGNMNNSGLITFNVSTTVSNCWTYLNHILSIPNSCGLIKLDTIINSIRDL